ncbi:MULTISPECIES: class I fructose-bisphosphate aldolase [Pseudonocardia]|uniref:fructose-bisphosphate aldolase n=2 Tax=Pseudonocardia TaxID=1847 RepID=A0A1Y2N8H7_PSEAH|nr:MULTISPECIES: class I fructose-bisphosphate aldolase [Pseudonocardia]OSY43501.1 fructose-1,6-bisphosphate aldolase [Pseudonocardia autotrophica]TDN73505.1 fructose-bisphosphate aldolase class I [Pseudonocardia autotrophica]BBG04249.1 fructose-bisphosphate aldolase [Pseudonocardia autotrophica]GEC25608.1 fructose-bisphosphate aldolase [Pseudonocardia saturnea]
MTDRAGAPPPEGLRATARRLVAGGRGVLAADESIATMSQRLDHAGVPPSVRHRRDYRELLVTADRLAEGVNGVILCEETLRQRFADGRTFPTGIAELGMLPGIKVDTGTAPLAGAPGETVTTGLDGLPERAAEFAALGARFAKWRAVFRIAGDLPSAWAIRANAHALARYAADCLQAGLVPIVEPEVLAAGSHPLERTAAVTARVLAAVTAALADAGVDPGATVLKPNMVTAGSEAEEAEPAAVARATHDVLRATVSDDLAGVAFLSGGWEPVTAAANLAAIRELPALWPVTFSFGRALVSPALRAWGGDPAAVPAAQAALLVEVRRNTAPDPVPA